MSHTRTPWKAINIGEMPRAEVNAITEPTVCVCGDFLIVVDGSRGYDNHEEDSNDASFIVKACNAHDELVAALKAIADGEGHADEIARQTLESVGAL